MSRTGITILSLIVYLIAFNIYVLMTTQSMLSVANYKILYSLITGGMILFNRIDLNTITDEKYHGRFNTISFLAVIANFILIICNHAMAIENTVFKILSFNGMVLAITISVLISGTQHGYFKNKYEND